MNLSNFYTIYLDGKAVTHFDNLFLAKLKAYEMHLIDNLDYTVKGNNTKKITIQDLKNYFDNFKNN